LELELFSAARKCGQFLPCQPSPFLKELVEHSDEISKLPVSDATGKDFFAAMRSAISC
jgi:hypothetical protein